MKYNKNNQNHETSKSQRALQALFTMMVLDGKQSADLAEVRSLYSDKIEALYGADYEIAGTLLTIKCLLDPTLKRTVKRQAQINQFNKNNFIA